LELLVHFREEAWCLEYLFGTRLKELRVGVAQKA
jgi:hypothetical protein